MDKNQQITKYFFLHYKKHSVIGVDKMNYLHQKKTRYFYFFFCAILFSISKIYMSHTMFSNQFNSYLFHSNLFPINLNNLSL